MLSRQMQILIHPQSIGYCQTLFEISKRNSSVVYMGMLALGSYYLKVQMVVMVWCCNDNEEKSNRI